MSKGFFGNIGWYNSTQANSSAAKQNSDNFANKNQYSSQDKISQDLDNNDLEKDKSSLKESNLSQSKDVSEEKALNQQNQQQNSSNGGNSSNQVNQNLQDTQQNRGSFAERFSSQRRSKFTSENLQSKEQSQSEVKDIEAISSNQPKKVDPKKKMLANLIYLVKGVDDGRNAWYYVLVDRLKVKMFLKALNDDIIHLENYGQILYSAYGDEPPKEITDALKEEYGIES